MIIQSTKRNKKTVTSSFFEDIKLLRKSRHDTDYRDLKMNSNFNVMGLRQAYLVQEIILWRKGCIELSDYVSKLPNNQIEGLHTIYMGENWVEDKEDVIETATTKEIADPDNNDTT